MSTHALELKLAHAIANEIGPSYDIALRNKQEWKECRGVKNGVSYDVNGPYKYDYHQAAKAALTAIEDAGYRIANIDKLSDELFQATPLSYSESRRIVLRAMIAAAEKGE